MSGKIKPAVGHVLRLCAEELLRKKRRAHIALLRLVASDKESFDAMKDMAKAIVEFRKMAPTLPIPGLALSADAMQRPNYSGHASMHNPDYFSKASDVLALGHALFGRGATLEEERQKYPIGFVRLRQNNMDGVENPIQWAASFVKACAIELYSENKRLSAIYKPEVKTIQNGEVGRGVVDLLAVDRVLTELARETRHYQAPNGRLTDLHRPHSQNSAYNLSL